MPIQPGQRIPASSLNRLADGIEPVTTQALFNNANVLLFAVPGAFTPTCSNQHLPGYVQRLEEFTARGIRVACMAVNDAFVMHAWAQAQQVPAELWMLADGNADFTTALGLEMDGRGFGMGVRARRFALYATNGVARIVHVEAPGEYRISSAEAMLQALDALEVPQPG